MSDTTTKVMLDAYEQEAEPTLFLSGMFQALMSNFHNSEEVEIDIVRGEEDIAIVIQDLSTGARYNSEDLYANKAFKPPIFKEAGPINAHTLIKRMPGQDPFQSVDFQANAIMRGMKLMRKLQRKILRAIEQQSSQVLTTGTVTLTDGAGVALYTISYSPKATHFPTSAVAWSSPSSTKLGDIQSLANVIRTDGLANPDMLIMGEGSYELFIQDAEVLTRLDNRRIEGNGIVPMDRMGNGGIYRGTVEIGNYKYDIWTYGGRYKDPATGNSLQYVPDGKVIVRASSGRLDATFGGIPGISNRPDPRVPAGLLTRISSPSNMADIQLNSWITEDDETMMVQAGTRPLMIPTAIDTYGCLDTGI